jgi:hypothetical protein
MLAKRWCGREAILMDVRRAAEDMMWRYRKQVEKQRRRRVYAGEAKDGNNGNGYHMAAPFRSALAEDWS